jgi:Amt family ammonium transporter
MVPLIMTGAWAERMTFKAFLIVVTVWPFFVYYPLAHWIWNENGWLLKLGILDFAGGLTIHTSAGCGALVISMFLHKRKLTKEVKEGKASNLTLTMIGTVLIWAGWYSFNGGSALAANDQAAFALVNTHMSASFSSMMWLALSYFKGGKKFSMVEVLSGTLAGLAAITPGSGYVNP